MKKKIWIPIVLVLLIVLLFIPIPRGTCDDGGTRDYIALTYRIIDWNRLSADGVYEKTRIYFGSNRNKAIDELWEHESKNVEEKFIATVLQIDESSVLVEPLEDEPERLSSDKISFGIKALEKIDAMVGSVVQITYKGGIMESSPAQINAVSWKLSGDLSHIEYTEQWLDKSKAEKYDNNIFDHIVITKIYSNCFFAKTVIPTPYEIKLNGTLSEDWCVGDQITCKYKNTYYDKETHRVECDFSSVKASDWQPDPNAAYKPVIYLYPEEKTDVSVKLTLNGKLTCTYPEYNNGWDVTAYPDGILKDKNGQTYNYLYWEGDIYTDYDLSKGFCIKGKDTAKFLEDALKNLGLNRREANEFIVYWLPLMQNNPYNIISFQSNEYTDSARLDVNPSPDTLIRVFMTWKKSNTFINLEKQTLTAPERKGFTLIEWGGTEAR